MKEQEKKICPLCGKDAQGGTTVALGDKAFKRIGKSHARLCFKCAMAQEEEK